MENNITFDDIRSDMCPWRLVKDLLEGKSGAEFFARGIEKRLVANQVSEQQNPMNDLVHVVGEVAFTDSLKIAEKFGKRHDSVLRAIDNLPIINGNKNFSMLLSLWGITSIATKLHL